MVFLGFSMAFPMVSKVVPMVFYEPSPRAPNTKTKKVRNIIYNFLKAP